MSFKSWFKNLFKKDAREDTSNQGAEEVVDTQFSYDKNDQSKKIEETKSDPGLNQEKKEQTKAPERKSTAKEYAKAFFKTIIGAISRSSQAITTASAATGGGAAATVGAAFAGAGIVAGAAVAAYKTKQSSDRASAEITLSSQLLKVGILARYAAAYKVNEQLHKKTNNVFRDYLLELHNDEKNNNPPKGTLNIDPQEIYSSIERAKKKIGKSEQASKSAKVAQGVQIAAASGEIVSSGIDSGDILEGIEAFSELKDMKKKSKYINEETAINRLNKSGHIAFEINRDKIPYWSNGIYNGSISRRFLENISNDTERLMAQNHAMSEISKKYNSINGNDNKIHIEHSRLYMDEYTKLRNDNYELYGKKNIGNILSTDIQTSQKIFNKGVEYYNDNLHNTNFIDTLKSNAISKNKSIHYNIHNKNGGHTM